MTEALKRYRELEKKLLKLRCDNLEAGLKIGSKEEYPIIEESAFLWYELSDEEREMLDAEGPTCFPDGYGALDDNNLPIENDVWNIFRYQLENK